ncbi:MAG: ATP-binding cassette domain-containing protein [Microbacterium sp.]|uniref:ATP-binding cassette domain-containing protein n=1 Tax=Microbacterium sp. TaxID=51671 RepID=UPI0039E67CD6
MPRGQVLEFQGVTKRFGPVTAVADLTATIEPGAVTGFLGPNGAGKTTSLRLLLGLIAPTAGRTRVGGAAYADLAHPLQTVGAALEASSFHPGRSAANHLKVCARAAGIPLTRIDEVLGLVGLADVAGRRVGGFSLGMRQRLGLATALLGDPGILVLDEPANGLDPEGITWMRRLLRTFADEGRTVLVSSHLLGEVQQTADRLLIMSAGRLVFAGAIEDLSDPSEFSTVVDSPDRQSLVQVLQQAGWRVEVLRSGLTVRGVEPAAVGAAVAASDVPLSLLTRRGPVLEEIFLGLVSGARQAPHARAGGPLALEAAPATVAAEPGGAESDPSSPLVEDAADLAAGAVADEAPDIETRSTDAAPPEAQPEEGGGGPDAPTEGDER